MSEYNTYKKYYDYFDEKFNVNPNTTHALSHDDKMCLELEKMATDLLNANKEDEYIEEYEIYSEKELFEKALADKNKADKLIFFKENRNFKKEKNQVITNKDKKKNTLEDYNDFISLLKPKEEQFPKYRRIMKELKSDMIVAKNGIDRPIVFKHLGDESCETDWYLFNFTDRTHIKALLKYKGENLNRWLDCILLDLKTLLNTVKLTQLQGEILELYMEDNLTEEQIAKELCLTQSTINKYIDDVIEKIIKAYNKTYQDWIYREKIKGNYKKCSKCLMVKIVQGFSTNKDAKDGYRNICKECRSA